MISTVTNEKQNFFSANIIKGKNNFKKKRTCKTLFILWIWLPCIFYHIKT